MSYGYVTPSTGWTISCWFKRDTTPTNIYTLFTQKTQASVTWPSQAFNTQGRQLLLELNASGALSLQFWNEATTTGTQTQLWTDPSPAGYANDNQWHFVAVRMNTDKRTWNVWLDGEQLASGVASVAANWKAGMLTFGAQYAPHLGDFGSYLWDKWLAYPAIYNKYLSNNRLLEHYTAGAGGTVYYGDSEITRMLRIADWAEVPDQSLEFEAGLVNLQGIQVAGTNALQDYQDASAAASGLVFADGQSRLVYHNRQHRYNRWSVATLNESTQSAPEVGVVFTLDDENIYNDIRGDRPFGSTVRIQDEVSKATHGRKTYSFSIPVTTHEELRNAVSWIANQYANPRVRVSNVSFRAESSDKIEWMATGGVTVGDRITMDELPEDAAPRSSMDFIVEKVSVDADIKNKTLVLSLELSPYEINKVFEVGVSTLGSTYVIGY